MAATGHLQCGSYINNMQCSNMTVGQHVTMYLSIVKSLPPGPTTHLLLASTFCSGNLYANPVRTAPPYRRRSSSIACHGWPCTHVANTCNPRHLLHQSSPPKGCGARAPAYFLPKELHHPLVVYMTYQQLGSTRTHKLTKCEARKCKYLMQRNNAMRCCSRDGRTISILICAAV
jgi:hypothetical protein